MCKLFSCKIGGCEFKTVAKTKNKLMAKLCAFVLDKLDKDREYWVEDDNKWIL